MSLSSAERVTTFPHPELARRPIVGVSPATRARVLALTSALLLFLVSLYPRAINLGGYLTTDEGNWMGRTALFARALLDGDPAGTYQSGHPGVMTMWASLIGMGPERALALGSYVRPDGLEKAPNYLETLHLARRSFAVLTSLAVVLVALLTWRLFGLGPALLAGVLLALEPFFLAHSIVAHVDSNVTTWLTVSILSALVYFWAGGGRGYLVASGLAAGLAFLSKAPSAFLPLFIPLVALGSLVATRRLADGRAWARLVADGLMWGLLALVVALALWPAFRADAIGTLTQMIGYTEAVGGSDHENYFMGQPVGDPGLLYYLVSLGFRLTPVTMLGLALLVVGLLPFGRRAPAGWAARVGILALFCVLFVLMMSTAPKKFDRYLLPIFPTLEILAAVGLWLALRRLPGALGARALPLALVVVGVAQAAPVALVYPYYLAYYNPLLGGGAAAQKAIVVGWGEGLDVVMRYLNERPDAERLTVAGFYPRVMNAQFQGSVLSDKQFDYAMADYIVLYVNARQRDLADRLRTLTRGKRPELLVKINGIEYARLYAVPPPTRREAAGTVFGDSVRLERWFLKSDERQYLKSDEVNPGDTLELTLRWALTRPVSEDLTAVVQLIDAGGALVAEHAVPVIGSDGGTSQMRPGEVAIEAHRLPLPLTNNRYRVAVGLRQADGTWLAISLWPPELALDERLSDTMVVVDSVVAQ
ncbi:MAG: glycosyltransferase family 39 protein [Chloroflexota bacterium]|nr:glycosyltransferase family 39 protein [Chloroflexota bacterium]